MVNFAILGFYSIIMEIIFSLHYRTKIIPDFSPKSQKITISNLTCFLDIFCIKIGIDGIAISAS